MKDEEYEMKAFRSNTTKVEPLYIPSPPPPPPLPRPSFMPPPPPPLSQSTKRFEFQGNRPVVRPMQNRFSKPPDQRHFQRPQHLPFLLPPPPPKIGDQSHWRPSPPPLAQYRREPQCSSLQRRTLKGKDDNSKSDTTPVAEKGISHLKTPIVKEETGLPNSAVRNQVAVKLCASEVVSTPDKTKRKRQSEKDLHTTDSTSSLPKELTQKFGPLKCDLCSVSVNSTVQAKMHYTGKQHEKKVHSFLLNWSKETGEPLPKQFKEAPPKKQSTPDVSFCEVCNIALSSRAHAEQHYMGRNHQRVLAGRAAANSKVEQCKIPAADPTGRFGIGSQFQPWTNTDPLGLKSPEPDSPPVKTKKFFCDLCKVSATSKDQLDMHLRGAKHRKAESANKQRSVTSTTQQATQSDSILASVIQNEDCTHNAVGKDYSINRTPSGYYYCQPCNLTLNSEAQFIQHCESKKHKVKTATAKKPISKPLKTTNVLA